MKEILEFLGQLKQNNNREWFEVNKSRYKSIQERYNLIVQELIDGVEQFDKSISGIKIKDCTYRIYRDVRFSPNKEPYKTHMGAYICMGGKSSGYAGYYFHLEPNNCLIASGLHCPEPKVVTSVRDEIEDNGQRFLISIAHAKGFSLDQNSKLQRVPKGFSKESEYAEYLKLKDFTLQKPIIIDDHTLQNCLADFKMTVEFNTILNRAVKFAKEEMK